MTEPTHFEAISLIKKNDRYFLALLSAFVLGLLLLFYKDLHPWLQQIFVPSYVIYIIGTAVIAQIQQMVGTREELRCKAADKPFTGSPKWFFRAVIFSHVVWFSAWVAYLAILSSSSIAQPIILPDLPRQAAPVR